MKTFARLLVFLCMITLIHAQPKNRRHQFVRKVRIVADYYSAMRITGTTPKQFLAKPYRWGEIDQTSYDREVYFILDSLISSVRLDAAPKAGSVIDPGITCLVYREHGNPDTVSFGGPHMQINNRIGYLQPGVLLALGEHLPRKFEADIHYYLDTIWARQPNWPKYGYQGGAK